MQGSLKTTTPLKLVSFVSGVAVADQHTASFALAASVAYPTALWATIALHCIQRQQSWNPDT
jgi:hypothetical protein